MRACLQAKLPVLAIVKQAALVPARQRMLETVRENLARQTLSPYEFGRQLKHVINAGLSPSARALGRDIGRHHGDVSAAIKLASLPDEVIEASHRPGSWASGVYPSAGNTPSWTAKTRESTSPTRKFGTAKATMETD